MAAFRLTQQMPRCRLTLFEASARLGGVLDTRREDDRLIERGADSFMTKLPHALDLCRELGLEDQLLPTNELHRRALVVRSGKLHHVPEGFVLMRAARLAPILRSGILSWRGKLRLMLEPWMPVPEAASRPDFDESVADFATRRLGRETLQRLVQPLLAGIYTADPALLSLAATMPEFLEAQREHRSLAQAMRAGFFDSDQSGQQAEERSSGARYGAFVTLSDGVGSLVQALADRLQSIERHLGCQIDSISPATAGGWDVEPAEGRRHGPFDGLIVATPAPQAARLLNVVDSQLVKLLETIPCSSSSVVSLVYPRSRIDHPLDGFGLVVPEIERRQILAASFSSVKFPGRATADEVLIRVFFGGALHPELAELPDDRLLQLAQMELSQLVGARGEPLLVDIARWQSRMPQYLVGHLKRVEAIENRLQDLPGLELAGNSYRGVGLPQCIRSGQEAAERLLQRIATAS